MTNPRTKLAAALRAVLPAKWPVQAHPEEPDAVASVLVVCFQSEIKPSTFASVSQFEIGMKVFILVSNDLDPTVRENKLDDALGRVLDVVDGADWLTWSTAERTTTLGFHSYEITATAVGEKTP